MNKIRTCLLLVLSRYYGVVFFFILIESTTRSSTKMPQTEHTASFASNSILNMQDFSFLQNIIDSVIDDTSVLQTACLNTGESIDTIQHMNMLPITESCNGEIFYILYLR